MTIARPTELPHWATVPTTGYPGRVAPNAGKQDAGYQDDEAPPAAEHNWLFGVSADWVAYLDDQRAAVLVAATAARQLQELQAVASWRQLFAANPGSSDEQLKAIAVMHQTSAASGAVPHVGFVCAVGTGGTVVEGLPDALAVRTPADSYSSAFLDVCAATALGGLQFWACGEGGDIQGVNTAGAMSTLKFGGNNLAAIACLLTNHSTGASIGAAVGGSQLWVTTNSGTTWTLKTSALGSANLVGAASDSRLVLSTDAGTDYGQNGTELVVIADDGQIQTSSDGNTWTSLGEGQVTLPAGATAIPKSLRYFGALGFRALFATSTEVGEIVYVPGAPAAQISSLAGTLLSVGDVASTVALALPEHMVVIQSNTTTRAANAYALSAAGSGPKQLDANFGTQLRALAPLAVNDVADGYGVLFACGHLANSGGLAIYATTPYRVPSSGDVF
jgi:hypothetical protein